MQNVLWRSRLGRVCLGTVISLASALHHTGLAAAEDGPDQGLPGSRSESDRGPNARGWQFNFPLQQDGGKYWLGVECREAPPELKSQLGLSDDEGLVAVHLVDDGPAAKAGIKRHDIIVSAGDQKLKRVPDLIKAVNASDGKEISFKIIRAGKEQTISVTPAERPTGDTMQFRFPGNMAFMFPPNSQPVKLPDNVTVTVECKGKDPAKITVTRGDEKWEVSDQELNKLPDELRSQVERIVLGVGALPFPPPDGFNTKGMRVEGMPMGDFHPFPPGMNPPPRDGHPPRHGGDEGPPPDGNPPPRDGDRGPPPQGGPGGPGGFRPPMMQPGQVPPELMERLDRLDHRLEMLQEELRHLREGGPGNMPRMRPHGPDGGPDGPPPRDDQRGGRPPRDDQRDGPPHDGSSHDGPPRDPPPNDR